MDFSKIAGARSFDQMAEVAAPPMSGQDDRDNEPIRLGQRDFQSAPTFAEGDAAVPRLRLAQGLTGEVTAGEAKPGQWVLSGYPAEDEVIFVPGLYNKGRERRLNQTEDPNRSVVCRSSDAVIGVGDPGGECAACPMAQWTPNPRQAGKNLPPACSLQYTYVGWSVTHEAMVSVTFQRTAEVQAQQINALIQAKGLGNIAIKLKSAQRTSGRNSFAVPVPVFYKFTAEQLAEVRPFLLGAG